MAQWWDKHLREVNDKVNMFHDKHENEKRISLILNYISSDCDKALKKRVQW